MNNLTFEDCPTKKDIESFIIRLKNPNHTPIKIGFEGPYILVTFEKNGEISVKIDPVLLEVIEVTKWDFR